MWEASVKGVLDGMQIKIHRFIRIKVFRRAAWCVINYYPSNVLGDYNLATLLVEDAGIVFGEIKV